jgi:hypothetical protein
MASAGDENGSRKGPLPHQEAVEVFYNSNPVQILVAIIIGLNFATNIIEKQIDPFGDTYSEVFTIFEFAYNLLFTIELGVNLYGHWCCPFFRSGWNIFDFVVVSIGIINTLKLPLPKAFSMLRMMRAFRVFRLFKRVRSLNKIIVAIAHAVPGVLNAFLILAIVMSIYAILAVEFFQNVGENCHKHGSEDVWFKTARGYCMGEEYFGTFGKSLYSFFQVLTGESWSEAVARPAIWYFIDDPIRAIGAGLFFVSYVLITAFVLTNVVVAVLLDKMVDPEVAAKADDEHPDAAELPSGAESADGNGVEGAAGDVAKPDGKDTSPVPMGELEAIDSQVRKLSSFSTTMWTDLDTARKEMVSLREQIDTVLRLVQENNG